ncbi:MAG: recombinase family protein [Oscillospiraceae bacterium]|nr:recombinase family protein [Oscillospiraceae bacterium]
MTNTKNRAVAYARYSSEMQRAESIDAQLRAIHKYAMENEITIVGEYIDRAQSGRSDDRPQFLEMIRDAREGLFDIAIVHQYSRFARNRYDSLFYTMELEKFDVRLVSVLEPSSNSPEDVLLRGILETINEYYSQNLGRETEKGKKENALKGMHVGGVPPLGYDVDRETMRLVINEREALAVKLIFRMHLDGCSYGDIEQALADMGCIGKRGSKVRKSSMHTILTNEKYTGLMVYNKSAAKDAHGKRNGHKYKDEAEIIKIEGLVPQIISKEDFLKAREIIQRRKHKSGKSKAKEVYLLSGKIVCGECGSNYCGNRRQSNKGQPYVSYTCNKKSAVEKCRCGEIRRNSLETFVLDKLAQYLFSDAKIPGLLAGYEAYLRNRDSEAILKQKNLRERIGQLAKEIENIVTVVAKTGSDALIERLNQLEQEKKETEYRLTKLEMDAQICRVTESDLKEAFKRARDLLKTGGLSNTKVLIQRYVHQVIIHPERIEVQLNFGFAVTGDGDGVDSPVSKNAIIQKSESPEAGGEAITSEDSVPILPPQLSGGFGGGERGIRTLGGV